MAKGPAHETHARRHTMPDQIDEIRQPTESVTQQPCYVYKERKRYLNSAILSIHTSEFASSLNSVVP